MCALHSVEFRVIFLQVYPLPFL